MTNSDYSYICMLYQTNFLNFKFHIHFIPNENYKGFIIHTQDVTLQKPIYVFLGHVHGYRLVTVYMSVINV